MLNQVPRMETSISSISPILSQIAHDGFAVIGEVFQASEVEEIQAALCRALSRPKAAVIQREGVVVGARNLLQIWPDWQTFGDGSRCSPCSPRSSGPMLAWCGPFILISPRRRRGASRGTRT